MKLTDVKNIIKQFIDEPIVNFQIKKSLFDNEDGRKLFNQTIKQNVKQKPGVYIWIDEDKKEIVYIGMAGKIKNDGSLGDHTIQKRLLAPRGKDKKTNKDIQTNDFVKEIMTKHNITTLGFHIVYSKINEPPAYIEALLLYRYYKLKKQLPKFNIAF